MIRIHSQRIYRSSSQELPGHSPRKRGTPLRVRRKYARNDIFCFIQELDAKIQRMTRVMFDRYFQQTDVVIRIRIRLFGEKRVPFGHIIIFTDFYPLKDFHGYEHLFGQWISERSHHRAVKQKLEDINLIEEVSGDLCDKLKNQITNELYHHRLSRVPLGFRKLMRNLFRLYRFDKGYNYSYFRYISIPGKQKL